MWKDFFYYSKGERRAVYVLSFIIVCLLIVLLLLPQKKGHDLSESDDVELVFPQATTPDRHAEEESYREVKLAPFNPNLADSIELLQLGLSPYVVRNVLRYREKGGRFRTPDSFARIYGLSEKQFETLRPYIRIPDLKTERRDTTNKYEKKDSFIRTYKYPEGTLVDVNKADTSELKKIPGIGSGISASIVNYRKRLGGFHSIEQLLEIKYVTPEMLEWFKIDSLSVHRLSANSAPFDSLRAHPYLNYHQAKVIVEHRQKRGHIKSLSQLSLYEEFTEKDLQRLAVYISFD